MTTTNRTLVLLTLTLSGCGSTLETQPPPHATPDPDPSAIAFVGASVVPMDSERTLSAQTVIVKDGRIVALGPSASTPVPPRARVIDAHGKFLAPGLMDMHAHLTDEDDLRLYLANGVTTVRNMWGAPIHLEWRARIDQGELDGPAIVTAGPILDGDPPAHDGSYVVKTPDDADRAVAMHKALGYDFIKVYTRLPADAYRRIVADAKAAGLDVAGHVPQSVGLEGAIDAGQRTIEHNTGFFEALQADSSPLKGKFDRESRSKKIDYIDESKLPALAKKMHDREIWSCPTRMVTMERTAADSREHLARPEMAYVKALYPAMWDPPPDPDTAVLARFTHSNDVHDHIIKALHDAGAHIVAGIDVGNPLILPGFSVAEEVALLNHAGLTRFEALRAATRDAAELVRHPDTGTIEVGKRADLVLLSGDPLADLANLKKVSGVMAHGHWYGGEDVRALLAHAKAGAELLGDLKGAGDRGAAAAFAGMPPLAESPVFQASFDVKWKGTRFGYEQLAVVIAEDGSKVVRARGYDGQAAMRTTMTLAVGPSGEGEKLTLEVDGTQGRGSVEVTRAGGVAHARGKAISGASIDRNVDVPSGALLGVRGLVSPAVLLAMHVSSLEVGKESKLVLRDAALASDVDVEDASVTVTRMADEKLVVAGHEIVARAFELTREKGPKSKLWLDAAGMPLGLDIHAFGAVVEMRRTN